MRSAEYVRWKPELSRVLDAEGATPDWSRIPVEGDISARQGHRLLFALAADPEFLVGDRLEHWSLDLVSAGLAMYALTYADTDRGQSGSVGNETIYWRALDMLFFGSSPDDELIDALMIAMEITGEQWATQSLEAFMRGREECCRLLGRLGIGAHLVSKFATRGERLHPRGITHYPEEVYASLPPGGLGRLAGSLQPTLSQSPETGRGRRPAGDLLKLHSKD